MASIPGQDLQREFLALTRKGQDTVVRTVKTWVETVKTVTPKLRTPEEALSGAFRMAERLLDTQRRLAEDLLKATVPMIKGGAPKDAS
jgi:hypothetical protein